jgi:hypothetical protein
MNKCITLASRGYGKTHKAIVHIKQLKQQHIPHFYTVLVLCANGTQIDAFMHDVARYYDCKYTVTPRHSITFADGTHYRFASADNTERCRGVLSDAVIAEDIELWGNNDIDFYEQGLLTLKKDGTLLVNCSLFKPSALWDYIEKYSIAEFSVDAPWTRGEVPKLYNLNLDY